MYIRVCVYVKTHVCISMSVCIYMCVCVYINILGDFNWFILSRDSNTNTYLKLPQERLGEGGDCEPSRTLDGSGTISVS